MTSVPEFGEPMETRLPAGRRPIHAGPGGDLGVVVVQPGDGADRLAVKESVPVTASAAVSARVKAMSESPLTTRWMFSTEAPVASAVAW